MPVKQCRVMDRNYKQTDKRAPGIPGHIHQKSVETGTLNNKSSYQLGYWDDANEMENSKQETSIHEENNVEGSQKHCKG